MFLYLFLTCQVKTEKRAGLFYLPALTSTVSKKNPKNRNGIAIRLVFEAGERMHEPMDHVAKVCHFMLL